MKSLPSNTVAINIDTFSGAIANTTVYSEGRLMLDDQEVDAINYPSKRLIKVNRSRWMDLRGETATIARFNLVIHEYLGIMGIDDTQYRVSHDLIRALSPSNFSPREWWEPMNPTNRVHFGVALPGVGCSAGSWELRFDIDIREESLGLNLDCEGSHWRIEGEKREHFGATSDGMKGSFHVFEIRVYNNQNQLLGKIEYSPEWGRCLVTDSIRCSQSGVFIIGAVQFSFAMERASRRVILN